MYFVLLHIWTLYISDECSINYCQLASTPVGQMTNIWVQTLILWFILLHEYFSCIHQKPTKLSRPLVHYLFPYSGLTFGSGKHKSH